MKKKNLLFFTRVLVIAFVLFFLKHFIQATIEFTDIIPVKPKAYIWGNINRAKYVIGWQFVFTFWGYILTVVLFYLVLKNTYVRRRKIWEIISAVWLIISLFLLYVHRYQFPYKKLLSINNPERFNYTYFEELIIYSIVGFFLVNMVRKWLLKP